MSLRANRLLQRARRVAAALLLLAIAALAGVLPVAAERPNGAGLVVRHGDGTLIYVYVPFEEESITSEELLYRSGLNLIMTPYGGLGTGVCTLDGEGCPADNCFCQSYTTPAYFWHFYTMSDGSWFEQIRGPSSRTIHDGDIDGWSWTAGASELPTVTIDEIALMNGVDRNAQEPTETPTPEPPTNTPTPEPTAIDPLPTPTETPTEDFDPTETATSPPPATMTATSTSPSVAAVEPSPSATQPSPSPTRPRATATARRTPTRQAAAATTSAATVKATTVTEPRAVIVEPGSTPVPLDLTTPDDDGDGARGYVMFGAMALVVVAAGAAVLLRGRWVGSR